MKEYRITKYDPQFRKDNGKYIRNEWIGYSDIGDKFYDGILTFDKYQKIEDKYIESIMYIANIKKNNYIRVKNIYRSPQYTDIHATTGMNILIKLIKNGNFIEKNYIPDLCRLILREHMWARLYSLNMFVHFGYDYYMYAGFSGECRGLTRKVKELGLFIERFKSPY